MNRLYFGVDALTHLDSTVRYGDGTIVVVDGNENVVFPIRVIYWVHHGYQANAPLLPSVVLIELFDLIFKLKK